MEPLIFDNDDDLYFQWLDKNPASLVVNTLRADNSNYFVLHKARCYHISLMTGHKKGAFTERNYIKIG